MGQACDHRLKSATPSKVRCLDGYVTEIVLSGRFLAENRAMSPPLTRRLGACPIQLLERDPHNNNNERVSNRRLKREDL